MLESRIEGRLGRIVRQLGGRSYKWVSPGNDGVPDRIVVMPGSLVYLVETKQLGEKARALQKAQHQRLRDLGCQVFVLAGMDDVEMFKEILINDQRKAEGGEHDGVPST